MPFSFGKFTPWSGFQHHPNRAILMPGFSITLHVSQHHRHPTSGRVVAPLCHCSYPSLHVLCLWLAEKLCHDSLVLCFFLYCFILFYFSQITTHCSSREEKWKLSTKNLNSFSCLSNTRIWILNLQHIHIYILVT